MNASGRPLSNHSAKIEVFRDPQVSCFLNVISPQQALVELFVNVPYPIEIAARNKEITGDFKVIGNKLITINNEDITADKELIEVIHFNYFISLISQFLVRCIKN